MLCARLRASTFLPHVLHWEGVVGSGGITSIRELNERNGARTASLAGILMIAEGRA
jgi:hypothetical protein